MTTAEVSDEDFQEVLAQTRHFVRTAVVPREQEILADDRVPDDLRAQAKLMDDGAGCTAISETPKLRANVVPTP